MKEIAREVTGHVCANRDFWSSPEKLARNSVILSSLAEANPGKVASLLEDVLDILYPGDIQSISYDASSNLVDALCKIAFVEDTFENVSGALLKLSCEEDEIINEEAAHQFISLFPPPTSPRRMARRNDFGPLTGFWKDTEGFRVFICPLWFRPA